MSKMIPFNKPYATGKELNYIKEAIASLKISGDGMFTKKCNDFFHNELGFNKALLTTSCTDALEMAAILIDIKEGDEVIMPSYTFVSTANAFVLRGAKIIFADSRKDHPGIDEDAIENLITAKTKAIVPVHYAGVACDMDKIMNIAQKHGIYVIEDAAQAIDSYYKGKPLGTIGHFGVFSFHETKNIISGEGGLLIVNDDTYSKRAEIIREKGTNRSAFFRGEVDKYGWVDVGSSFLPSDMIAAYLFAQLEDMANIQEKRKQIWQVYDNAFRGNLDTNHSVMLPSVPNYATNNAHMYYFVCSSVEQRKGLLKHLKSKNIHAVFHYLSLHESKFYEDKYSGEDLPNTKIYTNSLVRLPLFVDLTEDEQQTVITEVLKYFNCNG